MLKWEDSYTVGVEEFDAQHKHLFEIFAQVEACVAAAKSDEAHQAMDQLLRHMIRHIETEEAVMADLGFPDVAEHCSQHRRLTAEVLDYLKRYREITEEGWQLRTSLRESWVEHLRTFDEGFATFLHESGFIQHGELQMPNAYGFHPAIMM